MKYRKIICILFFVFTGIVCLWGCDAPSNREKAEAFVKNNDYNTLVSVSSIIPLPGMIEKDVEKRLIKDAKKIYSPSMANEMLEKFNNSQGEQQLKYLLTFLIFNKFCSQHVDSVNIQKIIRKALSEDDYEVLNLICGFYHGVFLYIKVPDEVLLENLALLCDDKCRLSDTDISLIFYKYDLKKIKEIIMRLPLSKVDSCIDQTEKLIKIYKKKNDKVTVQYYFELLRCLNVRRNILSQ